jgi:hypothetical protein
VKPEQQRIAIAEACGWVNIGWQPRNCFNESTDRALGNNEDWWRLPAENTVCMQKDLPDYLNDLNAMHEAEKVLDTETNLIDDSVGFESARDRYMNILQEITDARPTHQDDCEWAFITATAAQRAKAFLRTIGKWEDCND